MALWRQDLVQHPLACVLYQVLLLCIHCRPQIFFRLQPSLLFSISDSTKDGRVEAYLQDVSSFGFEVPVASNMN